MKTPKPLEGLPVLRNIDQKSSLFTLGDELQLTVLEGPTTSLPDYFQTAVYALNLHVRGRLTASINHQIYHVDAPCFSSILINQPIKVAESSDDHLQYVLSFSPQFAEDLHLKLSGNAHVRAYMRPVFPMTEAQMQVAVHYIDLLREVIGISDAENIREVALDLVRSMVNFVYGLYDKSFSEHHQLSHPEELTGRFLALVEQHCHEQHTIDWYASAMCLSPKYLANVVKQVTGRTTGECINENLIKQAKSLLLATTLPVQQIADRLGFKNQSHFGTFFRRATGMNPKTFRERP
jgi:AraC-like DNA-binding protein